MRSGAQGASAIIALLHPPKLVRVPRRRVRDRPTSRRGRRPVRAAALGRRVMTDRIHDLIADPEHRVQATSRSGNHREALPADRRSSGSERTGRPVKDDRARIIPMFAGRRAGRTSFGSIHPVSIVSPRRTSKIVNGAHPDRPGSITVTSSKGNRPRARPERRFHGPGLFTRQEGAIRIARHAVADRCKPVTTSRSRGRADDDQSAGASCPAFRI